MSTAIFKHYDKGNSETELHAHDGETVELLEAPHQPDAEDPLLMLSVQFPDGTKEMVFLDELKPVEETA